MKVAVTLEARFHRTSDGKVWCDKQFNFPHAFWKRYQSAFDGVIVVARVAPATQVGVDWREVTGPGVEVQDLPYYVGPWQYFLTYFRLRRALRDCIQADRRYILRVSSPNANMLAGFLRRRKIPYAVEVVGDPWEILGPGAFPHPLARVFQYWFTWRLKVLCAGALDSSYVTAGALQRRYPSPLARVSISASSIELKPEAIAAAPKTYGESARRALVFVGTLEQLQKGTDILLKALALLPSTVELKILGEGRMRPELEKLARDLGITERVRFLGAVQPGPQVIAELNSADVFVLPSRGEGLPRSMIEAMARGMFCVGSQIGGIQELLPAEWCVPVNDVKSLAQAIQKGLADPALMTHEARRNWDKAKEYRAEILEERRRRFYASVCKGRT